MKLKALATCTLLSAVALATGCSPDVYALRLIQPDNTFMKAGSFLAPSGQALVKSKTIAAAPRYKVPDKAEIDVWAIKAAGQGSHRGTVVILHDLGDSKASYLPLAKKLSQKGFDVVLSDFRAHGRSTGKYVTYGAKEKADLRHVMDKLLAEKLVAEPLYVFGAGMGGSVGIQYAASDPRVKGVMAAAPFCDLRSFARRLYPLMDPIEFDKVLASAGQLGKFKPDDASALKDIGQVHCPVLLMHGKLDLRTPYTDSDASTKPPTSPRN